MLMPWPSDAIMLVCASPALARTDKMESVNPGNCRDCGAPIVYDSRSMRRCLEMAANSTKPDQLSRPVKFFCQPCANRYDVTTCDRLVDHSGGKSVEVFNQKGAGL